MIPKSLRQLPAKRTTRIKSLRHHPEETVVVNECVYSTNDIIVNNNLLQTEYCLLSAIVGVESHNSWMNNQTYLKNSLNNYTDR